ncbi:hypothetical protein CB0940_10945 [Cercospora beticola]|uniref:RNase H type-1 domain-containing protein n=1 Tax=Cercospora beticola TaxID=122368 RepID=A0A2G5HDT9_CERBT|nr:hypothetical protein CB0940_10945 [Cercospora beticola]PIA90726.1 hypothetical protein CB0940_10945 [Cercospora beticola]WPB07709.1 hypothetical protein RHO25_012371 [Cercospora beticola]
MAPRQAVSWFSANNDYLAAPRAIEIFTDGSYVDWNRAAGCGFVFWERDHWACRAFALGQVTGSAASRGQGSQDAEKWGILYALDWVKSNWAPAGEFDVVILRVDSTYAIGDIVWEYEQRSEPMHDPIEDEIVDLIHQLADAGITVQMLHVPRDSCRGNQLADWCAWNGRVATEEGHDSYVYFGRVED